MQNLRVSIVQGDTRWHDPAGNREYYGHLIAPLHGTRGGKVSHLRKALIESSSATTSTVSASPNHCTA